MTEPGQSEAEEKSPLTPDDEQRWAELEANEKTSEEGQQSGSPKDNRRLEADGSRVENNNDRDDEGAFDSLPENVKSTVRELWTVIDRLHSDSITGEKLILDIARQLDEGGLCKRDHISRKIKVLLRDRIKAGKVTDNWVHKCLPDEYKRKYVRKVTSHLLRQQPQHKVALMQGGKSVILTENEVGNGLDTSLPSRSAETDINSGTSTSKSDSAITTQLQEEPARPPGMGGISQQQQPACKHCRAKDAIIKAQDAKIMDLEGVVRAHTLIKPAKELMHRCTHYQQVEFSVPFDALREYMHFNWNRSLDRVWFTGKLNPETGELIDIRIGRRTDTIEVKKDGV
jgi:hypothetical protein